MRIRNVKNKNKIIEESNLIINNPESNKGYWKNIFNNNNPIHIEIGMGKGNFIIESAKRNKNINYIGIEKEDSIICRALEKINDIDNLRFVLYDASKINDLFDREISRIYLNFSDPWPKKRHAKRRLTSFNFLTKYDKVFISDNEIFLKTDNIGLFSYSIESLNNYGYTFKNVNMDLENDKNNIETEYESKFRNKGVKINRVEAYKFNSGKKIAIISSDKYEIEYLIKYYKLYKENDILDIYSGKSKNKNIIVSQVSTGKVNSALATQHLIDKYNPDLIINTGITKSIDKTIKNTDIVIASLLTYHDFKPMSVMNKCVGINGVIVQDNELINKSVKIFKENNIAHKIVSICSGDELINDNKNIEKLKEETNCHVVDMESTSIAHVCFKNEIKSLIIKTIENKNNDEVCKNLSLVITKVVDSL